MSTWKVRKRLHKRNPVSRFYRLELVYRSRGSWRLSGSFSLDPVTSALACGRMFDGWYWNLRLSDRAAGEVAKACNFDNGAHMQIALDDSKSEGEARLMLESIAARLTAEGVTP